MSIDDTGCLGRDLRVARRALGASVRGRAFGRGSIEAARRDPDRRRSQLEAMAMGRPLILPDAAWARVLAPRARHDSSIPESGPKDVAEAIVDELRKPVGMSPSRPPTWDETTGRLLALHADVLNGALRLR